MIKILNLEEFPWKQNQRLCLGLCSSLALWVNLVSILR